MNKHYRVEVNRAWKKVRYHYTTTNIFTCHDECTDGYCHRAYIDAPILKG